MFSKTHRPTRKITECRIGHSMHGNENVILCLTLLTSTYFKSVHYVSHCMWIGSFCCMRCCTCGIIYFCYFVKWPHFSCILLSFIVMNPLLYNDFILKDRIFWNTMEKTMNDLISMGNPGALLMKKAWSASSYEHTNRDLFLLMDCLFSLSNLKDQYVTTITLYFLLDSNLSFSLANKPAYSLNFCFGKFVY